MKCTEKGKQKVQIGILSQVVLKKARIVLERIDDEEFEDTYQAHSRRYCTRSSNRDRKFRKYQDDSSSDLEQTDELPLNDLKHNQPCSSSDWEQTDELPLNAFKHNQPCSPSDWEEIDELPLNAFKHNQPCSSSDREQTDELPLNAFKHNQPCSSSDWNETDELPLNAFRHNQPCSSSDWEQTDELPLNAFKLNQPCSSSDWDETDQLPLNALKEDHHCEEEEEEDIILIDSIWGDEESDMRKIDVKEERIEDNSNMWIERLKSLQRCSTYSELENMALELSRQLEPMEENLKICLHENDEIDYVALKFCTHEVQHLTPISSIADGNCFPRSLSTLIYGDQRSHVELCVRIVIEGAVNKNKYLNNGYLSTESSKDLVSQYCMYSGSLVPCNRITEDSICATYENEMMAVR